MVGVLDPWDRYVANALESTREDDLAEVLEQMRLESWLPILVIA